MRYLRKIDSKVVEAVQYVEDDPTTHFHVNVGDTVSLALGGKPYVRTPGVGAAATTVPSDGDWIVAEGNRVEVIADAPFREGYILMPEQP